MNLAWGDVFDHREVLDKQGSIEARKVLTEVDDRDGGRRRVTNTPYRFSDAEAGGPRPGRLPGRAQLRRPAGLGRHRAREIDALHAQGVLLAEDRARDEHG